MTTREDLKRRYKRKKKLSIYTDEEKEFCEKIIEAIRKVYFVGREDKLFLEDILLKVIKGEKCLKSYF